MAAVERSFLAPLPNRLYLDTDILVSSLVGAEPHHERCRVFLDRLVDQGSTTIYVSSLTWIEFAHVVTRPAFRNRQPDAVRRRYRLERWGRQVVRQTYVNDWLADLQSLLNQFDSTELSLSEPIRRAAASYMVDYNIGSQDAVHLASAAREGIADVASLDAGYRRIDGLVLWNDLIHTRTRST